MVKTEVLGSHRGSIERQRPAALKDAIHDRVGQVLIVHDPAQAESGLFVVKIIARLSGGDR